MKQVRIILLLVPLIISGCKKNVVTSAYGGPLESPPLEMKQEVKMIYVGEFEKCKIYRMDYFGLIPPHQPHFWRCD